MTNKEKKALKDILLEYNREKIKIYKKYVPTIKYAEPTINEDIEDIINNFKSALFVLSIKACVYCLGLGLDDKNSQTDKCKDCSFGKINGICTDEQSQYSKLLDLKYTKKEKMKDELKGLLFNTQYKIDKKLI